MARLGEGETHRVDRPKMGRQTAAEAANEGVMHGNSLGWELRIATACHFLRSAMHARAEEMSDFVSDGRETAWVAGPMPLIKVVFTWWQGHYRINDENPLC